MNEYEKIINWVRKYFEENGKGCKAVIGISGGFDSSFCGKILVDALGKENVIGVLLPQGKQWDISMSYDVCNYLGIKYYEINIGDAVSALTEKVNQEMGVDANSYDVYKTNTPARIRMATLYGVSGIVNGRVVNTCNLSEDYVGYNTKFGDSAGDFSLLSSFTKTEARALAKEVDFPMRFIEKIPEDGMSGKSDEEKLGFSYAVLDYYIRTGEIDDLKVKERIDYLHRINLHKLLPMPGYVKE
ncbi:MAG: NAD(+) synthase [Bacilli bacterium]|nr:NAD(+) synthase [Bacilli bacterium]